MTLQAAKLGLYMHGMGGIKKDDIYDTFELDREKFEVIMGFTIGYIGDKSSLPEHYQAIEQPSERVALEELILSGEV